MSTSIDQRVVEMRFDNAQFESGVKTSLSTLDRLKQALNLDGAAKGLDSLSSKANGFHMNGMSSAIEGVSQKFNALEVVATGALLKIGAQAEEAGMKLLKSFTTDNISKGWEKFEKKTTSVATLVAQGFDQKEVDEQMERLNWFTDETSYNFTDMVDNIGKFTAAGKGLEESVTAMEGIANWAALSGQNAATASRAMYQLSQAMGKGALKYDDFKSILNANMATKEFQQNSVDIAIALGKVKKVSGDAGEALYQVGKNTYTLQEMFTSDALTRDAWFTSDVMMKTFTKYASAVNDVYEAVEAGDYETASEAMEKMGDKLDAFGLKAFQASQSARTWTDVVDSVKDAVSTGWMNTFQLIVGNSTEATRIFTKMANELYGIFAEGGNERNEWLSYWAEDKNGGRKAFLEGFSNLYYDLKLVFEPIKFGLRDAFGLGESADDSREIVGKKLVEISEKFRDFTRAIGGDGSQFQKIRDATRGLFTGLRTIAEGGLSLLKILSPLLVPLKSLVNLILDLGVKFGAWVEAMSAAAKQSTVIQGIITQISDAVKVFSYTLAWLIDNIDLVIEIAGALIDIFLTELEPAFTETKKAIEEFFKPFTDFIHEKFGDAFERLGDAIQNLDLVKVFEILTEIFDRIYSSQTVQNIITGITTAFTYLGGAVLIAWDAITGFVTAIVTAFQGGGISGAINAVVDQLVGGFNYIKDLIKGFFSGGELAESAEDADKAIGPLERIINFLKGIAKNLDPTKIAVIAFSLILVGFIRNVSKFVAAFGGLADAISGFLASFKKRHDKTILAVAVAIGVLAASLWVLSQVPPNRLKQATTSLLELMGAMAVLTIIAGALSKTKANLGGTKNFKDIAIAILVVAAAAAVLTLALIKLNDLQVSWALVGKIAILLGVMTAFALISKLLGKFDASSYKSAALVLAFAIGIKLIVDALMEMANGKTDKVEDAVLNMIKIMGALAVVAIFAGRISPFSFIGLLGLAWALTKVLPMLNELAKGDYSAIIKAIEKNKEVFIKIGILAAALILLESITGKGMGKFGAGLLGIAAAMLLLTGVVAIIGFMDLGTIRKGERFLMACAGLFAILGIVATIMGDRSKGFTRFSASILLITLAMYGLVGLVAILGFIPADKVKQGELALAGLVGILSAFMLVSAIVARIAGDNKTSSGIKVVTGLVVGIVLLTAELVALSLIPWEMLKNGMISMGFVVGALAVSMLAMQGIKDISLKTFVGAIILLGGSVAALWFLAQQPWENMIAGAASLAILAVGLSFALNLLTKVGWFAGAALKGMGIFAIFLAGLIGAMALLGALTKIDGFNELIGSGGGVLVQLGDTLGAFVGAIIGGIGRGMAASLPQIGQNITEFGNAIEPFMGLMGSSEFSGVADNMDSLMDVFLKITANNLLEKLTGMFGGTSSMDKFAKDLIEFGAALKGYSDVVTEGDGINEDAVNASVAAGKLLVELANTIPNYGGLVAKVIGDNTWTDFGAGLEEYGKALRGYSDVVTEGDGISEDSIKASVNAGKMLADLANTIPNYGGLLAEALGDNTWGSFSDGLTDFGEAIVKYSQTVAGNVNVDAVEASANAGKFMTELANTIPNSGGVIAEWLGDNDIGTFGSRLVVFGNNIVKYADTIKDLDEKAIKSSAAAGTLMVDLANKVPQTDGIITWFTGDNDIGDFGKKLAKFGEGIVKYANTVKELDSTSIETASSAATLMVNLANKLPKTSGLLSIFEGGNTNIETFGSNLKGFGKGIAGFSDSLAKVDTTNFEKVDAIVTMSSSFVTLSSNLGAAGERGLEFLGMGGSNSFENLGKNLNDFASQVSKFAEKLTGINLPNLSGAVNSFKTLVTTLNSASNINAANVSSFSQSLKSLGDISVDNFINAFTGASGDVTAAVTTFTGYFITDFNGKNTDFQTAGKDVTTNVTTGITTESATAMLTAAEQMLSDLVAGLSSKMDLLETAGADAVAGFVAGVTSADIRSYGVSLGEEFLAGVSDATGWNSPWATMIECGNDAAAGLLEGVSNNSGVLHSSGEEFGLKWLEGFRESIGWYCTPTKVKEFSKDTAEGMLSEAKKNGKAAIDAGLTTMGQYKQGLSKGADEAKKYLSQKMSEVAEAAGVAEPNLAALQKTVYGVYDLVSPNGNGIGDLVNDATESVENNTEAVKDNVEQVEKATEAVKTGTKATKEATEAEEEYFDIMDFGKDVVIAFHERFGAAFEDLGDTTPLEMSKAAVEALALATYEASEKAEAATNKSKKSAEDSKSKFEKIKEAFASLRASLVQTIDGQMDIFKEFDKKTELTGEQLLKNMRSQINGIAEWSAKISDLAAKGIDQGLLKKLAEMGPQGYEYVNAFTQMTATELQEANQLFTTSLQVPYTAASEIMASYAYSGISAVEAFVQAVNQNTSQVDAAMTGMAQEGKAALDTEAQKFDESGKIVDESTGQGVTDNESVVETATSEMINQVGEGVSTVAHDIGGGIAENLIAGMAEGIGNGISSVVTAASTGMGTVNREGVEKPEGINSPSKVWAEYGKFMDLGMAHGIRQFSDRIVNEATTAGDSATQALANAINQISAAGLDEDMTPVIAPVLDLSDIESGLGVMNRMMTDANNPYIAAVPSGIGSVVNPNYRQMSNLAAAINGMQTGAQAPNNIQITINTQPGQNSKEIADMVIRRLDNSIARRKAVFA